VKSIGQFALIIFGLQNNGTNKSLPNLFKFSAFGGKTLVRYGLNHHKSDGIKKGVPPGTPFSYPNAGESSPTPTPAWGSLARLALEGKAPILPQKATTNGELLSHRIIKLLLLGNTVEFDGNLLKLT
jgi:hypothetical protein